MKDIVSITKCSEYEYNAVRASIEQNIRHLGGLGGYISKGERVLLKINMLMKKAPEEASTTHPVFVRALSDILLDYGCKVVIGDSPGGPFGEKYLRGIYKATGMQEIADTSDAVLNTNYNGVEKENPSALLLKRLLVADMINDVDKIISVSKMKTHGMMAFTGAVKSMFGIVPGLTKVEHHMNMPDHDTFADALIDVCLAAGPILSFMDGIVAMEGAGPSAGVPRQMGLCFASNSPFALDMAAVSVIGLPFAKVPTIRRAQARGLSPASLAEIEFYGEAWQSVTVKDFDIPATHLIFPFFSNSTVISAIIGKLLHPRPVFIKKSCIGCRDCEKCCPAKVITMSDGLPQVRLDKCIRCFCCQELCPKKAVKIHRPALLRLLTRL